MIYEYFSQVRNKLDIISWIILEQNINFDVVSDDMGILKALWYLVIIQFWNLWN